MKKIKVQVRLGRYTNSNTLYLKIKDRASRAEFLDLEFDAEQLANLMNQSFAYMEGKAIGLEFVGKRKVSESFFVEIPNNLSKYDKKEIAIYLEQYKQNFEAANPGWFLDTSIGSKSSIVDKDNKAFAHLRQYTFIKQAGEK